MKRVRGALGLVRRWVGGFIAVSLLMLPLSVVLGAGIVGLPILSTGLRMTLRALTRAGREREGRPPVIVPETKGWSGPITIAGAVVFAGALLLVVMAAQHVLPSTPSSLWIALAIGAAASVGLGVALAPLMFAPLFSADGVPGWFAPFSRSFQLAARMGPGESRRVGALVGGAMGLGFLGVPAVFLANDVGVGSVIVSLPLCVGVALPLAIALLADAFVEHESPVDAAQDQPAEARLRGMWALLTPALLGIAAAVAAAAVTPSPMRQSSEPDALVRGFRGVGLVRGAQRRRIPGTTVTVRTLSRGVSVEADDGGGAGPIDARFPTGDVGLYLFEREQSPGTYLVAVTDGERWATTVIDRDGVRLDDGITERVFERLGRPGLGALALGMLLLLWIAFSLASELGTARALEVPSLLEGGDAPRGLAALEGTLRVADDSRLTYRPAGAARRLVGHLAGGSVVVQGEAWVEAQGGAIRLRLPERPVPVLEGGHAKEWEGEHVVVLSRFDKLATTGLRTSSVPWPEDGLLTLGTRGDAAGALVKRAVTRASWFALPTMLFLGAAAAKILWSL